MIDEYLQPPFCLENLDRVIARRAILKALQQVLPRFHGTVLDIGCGHMPYRSITLLPPSQAQEYIGLDLDGSVHYKEKPDLVWDGKVMPLQKNSIDWAIATEVLEHCPFPEIVTAEAFRVLKPGGGFFLTVPFLWPLHDVPYDEYRYTPFSLRRHLENVGFREVEIQALGGWDASLAQMIGLWARRRPLGGFKRWFISVLAKRVMKSLLKRDDVPDLNSSVMLTGMFATAVKRNSDP